MKEALHTVAETATFLRDAAEAGLSEETRADLVSSIAADPLQGEEVVGSGGVRKMRVAGRGKGKSGGFRVMVGYLGADLPVYLLALLSKGDRANSSKAEIAAMKAAVTTIQQAWRQRRMR
jgi:hypothetical protein